MWRMGGDVVDVNSRNHACNIWWLSVKAPITPDEYHEDRIASWKFRWTQCGRGQKEKCVVFKFILRLYYVPARFSLRLTRLCQVLTASNTFPLISYHVHYHARTTSNALFLRSYYDQSDRTTWHVLTALSLRPSGLYKYCTTRWVGYLSPDAKCRVSDSKF